MSASHKLVRRPAPAVVVPPRAPVSRPRHTPVPTVERALLVVVLLHLCFLPWAFGTVHLWSQTTSLGLASLGFIISLWPRQMESPAAGFRRLARWPFFYAGFVLLGYVAVQGANPAWTYVADSRSWSLVARPHLAWLPSGVDAPLARSNPWRHVIILASLWLLVCSLRAGFLRRQSYRLLLAGLAVNAATLAGLGMAELVTGTGKIFWAYQPSNPDFAASFIYRNHAGAYLELMVAVATALAWWHFRRSRRLRDSPAPTIIFAFLASFVGLMVIFSASRMAICLTLVFGAAAAAGFSVQIFGRRGERGRGLEIAALFAAVVACSALVIIVLNSDAIWPRFAELATGPAATMGDRAIVRRAAGEMLADNWKLGWGAGSFRYAFPLYQQRYPAIYNFPGGLRKYWEHAHDDLLEIPIEYGAWGLLPVLVALAIGGAAVVRRRAWRNPVTFCLLVACLLTVAHGWVDFVFQCPAVLLTWSVLLVAASRWAELDHNPTRHRVSPQKAGTRARGAGAPP